MSDDTPTLRQRFPRRADVHEARQVAARMVAHVESGRPYVQNLSDELDKLLVALGCRLDTDGLDDEPDREFIAKGLDVEPD